MSQGRRESDIYKELGDLARNAISRGVLSAIGDGGKMQSVQVKLLAGEALDEAERFQNYGFTSVPKGGAEAVVVFVGADRSHPVIVVADDRRCRKAGLKAGEVAVYHENGDFIHLKEDNEIEIKTKKLTIDADDEVTIKSSVINLKGVINTEGKDGGAGNTTLRGDVTVRDGVLTTADVNLNTHRHTGPDGDTDGPHN